MNKVNMFLKFAGWTIANFLYWLDRKLWRPSETANSIISWMEMRGLCCEKHKKERRAA